MKNKKDVLAKIEAFPHAKRVQFMVELGRNSDKTPWIREALAELAGGGCYERCLALHACFGSRDHGLIRGALADPSATVRGLAITLAQRFLPDEDLADHLIEAPRLDRQALITGLIRRDRLSAIDRFAERLAMAHDRRLAEVLPRATSPTVARHLAQWMPQAGPVHWKALARFHARTATETLYGLLSADDAPLPALHGLYVGVLEGLLPRHPDLALSLIEFAGTYDFRPPVSLLLALFRLRPNPAVAPLLAHPAATAPAPASLGRLDAAHLRRMLRERPELVRRDLSWFRRLPPGARDELYLRHRCAFADEHCVLPPDFIARLSAPHRHQEARTQLASPALAADLRARLRYAAFLPWDEAFAFLDPFLSHSDAELRIEALQALIRATAYTPERLGRTLAVLAARKNEQDPVRQAIFRGLVQFPPGRFQEEHLEPLGRIMRAALDATDLAWVTSGLMQQVISRILPLFPAWGANQLAVTVVERGVMGILDMERRIDDDQMRQLAPHLAPVVRTWATREREYTLVLLAQRLGRRIRVFPELCQLLEEIVSRTRESHNAEIAGALLRRWQPERYRELVPKMIREDPSCLALACVVNFTHAHRQDLLGPFLGTKKMPRGRFSTGKTRWILPVHDGFGRWTRTQQRTFAELLGEVAGERDRDAPALAGVIRQLARLPEVDVKILERLSNGSNAFSRNLAIAQLANLDDDAGLPELTRCMQDERASVAIYAVLRRLRRMSPAAALAFLRSVPLRKVTVAKEVLRLAGSLRTDAALEMVLEAEAGASHKDVRIAILRALWNFLDRPAVWEVLHRVVREDPAEVAFSLVQIPVEQLDAAGLVRFNGLLTGLLGRGGPDDRVPVLTQLRDQPLFTVTPRLAARLVELAGGEFEQERILAASVLVKFAVPGTAAAGILGQAVAGLHADPERLLSFAKAVFWAVPLRLRHLAAVLRPIIGHLAEDPARVHLAAVLAVWTQPPQGVADLFESWAAQGWFLSHVVLALHESAQELTAARPPEQLHEIETALCTSPHVPLRLVALSLLRAQAAAAGNYDASRRARLLAFRDDPAIEVAVPAAFVILPPLPVPAGIPAA